MKKITLTFSLALSHLGQIAFAHDGHSLGSTHWHATDVLGFVAAVVVVVAFYFSKK